MSCSICNNSCPFTVLYSCLTNGDLFCRVCARNCNKKEVVYHCPCCDNPEQVTLSGQCVRLGKSWLIETFYSNWKTSILGDEDKEEIVKVSKYQEIIKNKNKYLNDTEAEYLRLLINKQKAYMEKTLSLKRLNDNPSYKELKNEHKKNVEKWRKSIGPFYRLDFERRRAKYELCRNKEYIHDKLRKLVPKSTTYGYREFMKYETKLNYRILKGSRKNHENVVHQLRSYIDVMRKLLQLHTINSDFKYEYSVILAKKRSEEIDEKKTEMLLKRLFMKILRFKILQKHAQIACVELTDRVERLDNNVYLYDSSYFIDYHVVKPFNREIARDFACVGKSKLIPKLVITPEFNAKVLSLKNWTHLTPRTK